MSSAAIMQLKKQFESIGEASGRIEKEELINIYSIDNLFLETLKFVFNPYIITGLAKKKMEKKVKPNFTNVPTKIEDMFLYLQDNNSGSDTVISYVQGFILNHPGELHQFLRNIFCKDVQIGVSHKTINKVVGKNFIPEYSVQLAKNYFDEEPKVKGKFIVSLKLDGIRCTVFNEESGPKFFTRKGLPIEGLVELEESFKLLPTGKVYDGELVHTNPDNIKSDDLFRLTQKKVRKDGIKKDIRFIAFDTLSINEFHKGKSKLGYEDRLNILDETINSNALNLIELVPIYYIGEDKAKISELLKYVTSEGFEGLMVNIADSKYETKRSKGLLKVKKFNTVDLRIIGFEEHRKQPERLGSLIVDYKGYKVNVGSGFDDKDRKELWDKREDILNAIVEVQYFEESRNQNEGLSLRFPVFLGLRDDKDEVSYN